LNYVISRAIIGFSEKLFLYTGRDNMDQDRSVNYELVAHDYDRRYQGENDYSGIQHSLLKFVGNSSTDVLEVGCGTGHWLSVLTDAGLRAAGMDPARNMLDFGRRKLPQAVLVQGRAESLPWDKQVFDRIFCINAIQHFSDKGKFLQEAYRVLRPGGGIMISGLDPHTGLDRWWIYDYFPQVVEIDRKRYPASQNIHDMMLRSGFRKCQTIEVLHMPIQLPAIYALEKGQLAKNSTSQLIVLTDEEYNLGIDRLKRDIEEAEARRSTLSIYADLRIYATTGWVE
jgi:ubiquinone/menaquinone biosynthesis C-methylase UbiE